LAVRARGVGELLLEAPCKAYDLIAAFREAGQVTSPPTVYRALDFLIAVGLAHHVVSENSSWRAAGPTTCMGRSS
jgi:Fur family zinc uptake transcriptional regulator